MRLRRRKAKVCTEHGVEHRPVVWGLVISPPKGALIGDCMIPPGPPRTACPECWAEARS